MLVPLDGSDEFDPTLLLLLFSEIVDDFDEALPGKLTAGPHNEDVFLAAIFIRPEVLRLADLAVLRQTGR